MDIVPGSKGRNQYTYSTGTKSKPGFLTDKIPKIKIVRYYSLDFSTKSFNSGNLNCGRLYFENLELTRLRDLDNIFS